MSPPNLETNSPISQVGNSLLVRANEGSTPRAFGHAIAVLLDGEQTGLKFTAFLNMTPPGGGPGPHYHEREDEWFYVVEETSYQETIALASKWNSRLTLVVGSIAGDTRENSSKNSTNETLTYPI